MTTMQILFIIIAATTLGAAIMVVTTRKLIHAALWLILSLFGVAILYVFLDASFLAVAQVVVYIGAIAILMIFAIMLTRNLAIDVASPFNNSWPWALLLAVLMFAGLVWLLSSWDGVAMAMPDLDPRIDPIKALGISLVSPDAYVLPFEIASLLLLGALVGSIIIAWPRNKNEG